MKFCISRKTLALIVHFSVVEFKITSLDRYLKKKNVQYQIADIEREIQYLFQNAQGYVTRRLTGKLSPETHDCWEKDRIDYMRSI